MARQIRSTSNTSTRASRHAKPIKSYQDPSTDEEEDYDADSASNSEDDVPLVIRGRGRNSSSHHMQPMPSPAPAHSDSDSCEILYEIKKKRTTASPKKSLQTPKKSPSRPNSTPRTNTQSRPKARVVVRDPGIIPPWTILPYQILVLIFEYAASPLHHPQTFHANESAIWLLRASRVCRAFSEPALTVLYRCPPLVPMERAHKLVQLLRADDQDLMTYKYRSKVESVQMEVTQTAMYTLSGFGLLDIYGLVYNTPRLQELELHHVKDLPPYRQLEDVVKWNYPDGLFVALEKNCIGESTKLKSWRWNARLAGKKIPVEKLKDMHERPYFKFLEKCAIVNYQVPRVKKGEEDPKHDIILAESLKVLENLKHLVLESSTLVNDRFMPILPPLQHLEIINCWEITSEDLVAYLQPRGHQLQSLTLNHNTSLNLSFLTTLKTTCPKLKSLKMDLTYYSIHSTYNDKKPNYSALVEEGETPDWPSSLESIELLQLAHWDRESVQRFFRSLLDSASDLPNLRKLIIKVNLNISWKDRAVFREEWIEPFKKVFERKSKEPNTWHYSIKDLKKRKAEMGTSKRKQLEEDDSSDVPISKKKQKQAPSGSVVAKAEDEVSKRDTRSLRSESRPMRRLARGEVSLYVEVDTDEERDEIEPSTSSPKKPLLGKRELDILHATAGLLAPNLDISTEPVAIEDSDSSSSDEPLVQRRGRNEGRNAETDRDGEVGSGESTRKTSPGSQESPKKRKAKQFIQGLCTIVDVKVDNSRPAETQFKESDFIDEEAPGDSDYDD